MCFGPLSYDDIFSCYKICRIRVNIYCKCSNYRSISLLSNIDKVLERLTLICNFLEIKSLICDLQFGFKQKCSTPHALIHLTERTSEQPDRGYFASRILVDLQKVFDTVDHDILIQKSNHYGVRGVANNCFSSYLQNRLQYVSVNCSNSKLS